MLPKRVRAVGHGGIHFAMLLHFVGVAMPVHGQGMHVMLFGQCWNQMLAHAPKTSLHPHVAAVENSCHKKRKAGLILQGF